MENQSRRRLLRHVVIAQAQQPAAQQVVQWQLQVMRDGQQIDAFDGTTTVGQARTDTHHQVVQHNVGCKDAPGGSIDLSRTLTVSPLAGRRESGHARYRRAGNP